MQQNNQVIIRVAKIPTLIQRFPAGSASAVTMANPNTAITIEQRSAWARTEWRKSVVMPVAGWGRSRRGN